MIPEKDEPALESIVLGSYYFRWGDAYAWAVGYSVLMNHSDDPCVRFERQMDSGLLVFIAGRDIAAGEELCISYGDHVVFSADGSWKHADGTTVC